MIEGAERRQDRPTAAKTDDGLGRSGKIVLGAVLAPYTAVVMAGAGALLTAIVVAMVSGGSARLSGAVVTLLSGVLVKGVGFGVAAAVVIGAITLVFDKDSVIALAGTGGILAYLGFGLWSIFVTAVEIHTTGAWIGAGVGAAIGVVAGLAVAKEGLGSDRLRAASRHRRTTPGIHPAELEWWRGDIDSLDGGDD